MARPCLDGRDIGLPMPMPSLSGSPRYLRRPAVIRQQQMRRSDVSPKQRLVSLGAFLRVIFCLGRTSETPGHSRIAACWHRVIAGCHAGVLDVPRAVRSFPLHSFIDVICAAISRCDRSEVVCCYSWRSFRSLPFLPSLACLSLSCFVPRSDTGVGSERAAPMTFPSITAMW